MTIDVVLLPEDLPRRQARPAIVVFDVLRATTTMIAALAAGVREVRVYSEIESARRGAAQFGPGSLLCGEARCFGPAGFDLGNSPGDFSRVHEGRTLFMSTTNGTRAILAARDGEPLLIGALVNAAAVAAALHGRVSGVTLLCAGTNGRIAMEDVVGAGAVMHELQQLGSIECVSDAARMALGLFLHARSDLRSVLREGDGGRNVMAAGLGGDIDFAAKLNSIAVAGYVQANPLRVIVREPRVAV